VFSVGLKMNLKIPSGYKKTVGVKPIFLAI
jgi:hypothetical protein